MKNNSPQTRLAMAFPLVCSIPGVAGAPLAAGMAESADAIRPHTRQNLSSAVMLFPHAEHNNAMHPPGSA
jgi:hypothetical protein